MHVFSIVIPTKEEEENLPKILQSIADQTIQPEAIIVADAQSKDKTRSIAKKFGAKVVEGGLIGEGRNAGAKEVTSEVVIFFDADVVLPNKTFLEDVINEFTQRGLGVATCDLMPLSDKKVDEVMHKAYNKYVRALEALLPHAGGAFIVATKQAHDAVGGFDESITFCEDHVYAREIAKIAPFGILKSVKLPVSVRRLDKDGRLNIIMKFALAEAHLVTLGPIRDNRFNYTFDHKKKED